MLVFRLVTGEQMIDVLGITVVWKYRDKSTSYMMLSFLNRMQDRILVRIKSF